MFWKKKEKKKSCNEEINILDIKNNAIYTRDNYVIMALKLNSINIQLFSKRELNQKVKEITSELASDLKELKFLSISRPVDVTDLVEKLRGILSKSDIQKQKNLLKQNIRETIKLTITGEVVERQNFITIFDKNSDMVEKELLKRAMDLVNKFGNCGIKVDILNEKELIQLCNSTLNINFAFREDNEYEEKIPYLQV
ncbi:MAG: hypothetical protein ACI4OT_00355 [Bacilli bacterium]